MKRFQKIVATVNIYVQENPHAQGDLWPTTAQEFPAGNPVNKSSRSCSRRSVSAKPWFISLFIIVVAIAFSSYSWLDALDSLRSNDEAKTFVRRAIVTSPVSLATLKVPKETLNTTAPQVSPYQIAKEEPKDESAKKAAEELIEALQDPMVGQPLFREKTTLFDQALVLQKDGRFQEAKKMYEAALEHSPNLVSALNNLGAIYIKEKNYSEALRVLEKATLAAGTYTDPYYNLACLYALQTDVEQSVSYLKKAIAADDTVRDRAKRDQDLENIRGHVEYERIVRHVEKP